MTLGLAAILVMTELEGLTVALGAALSATLVGGGAPPFSAS